MNEVILDTDILSEVLKAKDKAVYEQATAYQSAVGHLTTTTITLMEIVFGLQRRQQQEALTAVLRFVKQGKLIALPFDNRCAILAGELYAKLEGSGQRIGQADTMIAATAVVYQLPLVTGNQRHYQRIVDQGYNLTMDNWRES